MTWPRAEATEPRLSEEIAKRYLAEDFESVRHIGPLRAAEFLHGEPHDAAQADAWGAVRDLLDRIPA